MEIYHLKKCWKYNCGIGYVFIVPNDIVETLDDQHYILIGEVN